MHMVTGVKRWTLDEVHSLPDDGNKYELIHGQLFVTPPPSADHATILARLTRLLEPYVARHNLGLIYHPRAVVRVRGSETEPDLMVRQPPRTRLKNDWEKMPLPILVVEVVSPFTRRRNHLYKRRWYTDIRVSEYWIVDAEERSVTIVKPHTDDRVVTDTLHWHPAGADAAFECHIEALFDD